MEENLQKRVGFGPRLGAYLLDAFYNNYYLLLWHIC